MGRVRSSAPRPLARSRLPLRRRVLADPAVARRWAVVVALAALTAATTAHLVTGAESARRAWGRTRPVLVVDRPVGAGDPLADAVRTVRWPTALAPADTVDHLPSGAEAAADVDRGLPLTTALVTAPGASRADGRLRVALRRGDASLPVAAGDRVDVWATVDPSLSGGRPGTRAVAREALVTEASDDTVVVAVTPAEVGEVAEAAALATITLVGQN